MKCFVLKIKIGNDANYLVLFGNADATTSDVYCEPTDLYHFTNGFNRDLAAQMIRTLIHVKHEEGIASFDSYEMLTGEFIGEDCDEDLAIVFKKKNSPHCYTFGFIGNEDDVNTARKMANRLWELVHNVKPYKAQANKNEDADESEELF